MIKQHKLYNGDTLRVELIQNKGAKPRKSTEDFVSIIAVFAANALDLAAGANKAGKDYIATTILLFLGGELIRALKVVQQKLRGG